MSALARDPAALTRFHISYSILDDKAFFSQPPLEDFF